MPLEIFSGGAVGFLKIDFQIIVSNVLNKIVKSLP